MIPAPTRRVFEQLARLEPGDLTAWAPVTIGTEAARELLQALQDAETLRAVRALIESGRASPDMLRTLLAATPVETHQIRQRRRIHASD